MKTSTLPFVLVATFGLLACETRLPSDQPHDTASSGDGDGDESGTDDGIADPDEGDEPETTGPGFVPDVEDGTKACDPWAQDCPAGEKCVPYGSTGGNWDANKCVPVNGDGQPGDACSWDGTVAATDSCGADSHCWDVMDVDGELVGVCTPFCVGSPNDPICGVGTSCLIVNEGSITLCVQTCDPLLQECGEGLGCFWANNDFQCIFTTGQIQPGGTCGFINDCAPGLLCAASDVLPACEGSACCTPFCDLADPSCGDPDTECVPFFEEGNTPPTLEDIGVCVIPGA